MRHMWKEIVDFVCNTTNKKSQGISSWPNMYWVRGITLPKTRRHFDGLPILTKWEWNEHKKLDQVIVISYLPMFCELSVLVSLCHLSHLLVVLHLTPFLAFNAMSKSFWWIKQQCSHAWKWTAEFIRFHGWRFKDCLFFHSLKDCVINFACKVSSNINKDRF